MEKDTTVPTDTKKILDDLVAISNRIKADFGEVTKIAVAIKKAEDVNKEVETLCRFAGTKYESIVFTPTEEKQIQVAKDLLKIATDKIFEQYKTTWDNDPEEIARVEKNKAKQAAEELVEQKERKLLKEIREKCLKTLEGKFGKAQIKKISIHVWLGAFQRENFGIRLEQSGTWFVWLWRNHKKVEEALKLIYDQEYEFSDSEKIDTSGNTTDLKMYFNKKD